MLDVGRFGLRGLADSGAGFLERALLMGEIGTLVQQARKLERSIQGKQDAGKDTAKEQGELGTLNMQVLALSTRLILSSVATLDGEAVDMEDEEDAARVRQALGRLSRDEWQALTQALQRGETEGDSKS